MLPEHLLDKFVKKSDSSVFSEALITENTQGNEEFTENLVGKHYLTIKLALTSVMASNYTCGCNLGGEDRHLQVLPIHPKLYEATFTGVCGGRMVRP